MSNTRLFSPEMFETFEVEVDFWENQRYKPLGGWAPPYLGTFPNHSNLVGDKAVDFEKVDQLACLPEGWSWVESKWEVDVPEARRSEVKSFPIRGETDGDGWSYAGSMETLIKSAQDRLLLSERSAMNTARRRRWRRTRRCVQGTAKKIENYRRDYVKKTCRSIDTAIDQSTKLATTMQDFHYKWRRSVDNVLRINDKLNKDTAAQLVFVRSKLTLLKECLMDIGQIEASYAARLRGFSTKWMNAGQKDFNRQATAHKEEDSITRRLSMTLLGASNSANLANTAGANGGDDSVNSDDEAGDVAPTTNATENVDEENEDKGFFRAIARANEEIADHKNVFASSLNSLLPSDIDRILSDLEDLIEDHLSETSHTRSQLLTLREVAEETLSVCVSAAFNATRRLSIERSVYMDSLSVISALWDARTELVPPLLNEELVDVNNIYPSLEAVSSATAEAHQSHSAAQYAPVTGHATQDSWFLLLRYAQTLVQANASMLLLHAQSKVYQRKMTQQCTSVSDLLMSLVKLFAHEHFRCYSEAQTILLEAIGAIHGVVGGTGKSATSTEGDAEHDLQQLHSQQLAQATIAATGTLKVSQSHVEAIRQRHMQALPSTKDNSDDAALLSHQGLNEEDLAAHLATTAIAPVTEQQPRRHILGAPVNRSTSTNKIDNNNANTDKSPLKKGPVEMPPLATILPFISLFRSKILCMAEVRFLCLAPASTQQQQQVSAAQQNTAGLSLVSNSLAASVPQWRWQKAVLVLTQDLCMHLLDLGVSSQSNQSVDGNEVEKELTMDDFYRAAESGLDSFRVFFTCSVARSSVLPLLLTTDGRFANTFQIRLHPAYHTMTLTPTTHSSSNSSQHDHHHEASVSHGSNATTGIQKMESAASSFFSSMFSSSLAGHTQQQQQHHHHHHHHPSAAANTSHTSASTTSAHADATVVNLSSVMSVFVGNTASNGSSTALATSLSSTLTSSAATQIAHSIASVEAIHATGKYAAVHCEPRPANTYHANVSHVANVCALLIAPVSAATAAMLLKKLSAPFCDVSLKTPEGYANDVLANPSGENVAGLDTAVSGALASSASVSSGVSSGVSSSAANTNAASSYFVSSMSNSSVSSSAAMGTDEDDLAIASANPMMGLSTSSATTSATTSSVSVSSTSVSSGLSTSNTANTSFSSSSSSIGNNNNTTSLSNSSNNNGVSSGSGGSSSSVPMMANPLMKNPLKRTSSAVMKKQQMNNAGNSATSATISEEK